MAIARTGVFVDDYLECMLFTQTIFARLRIKDLTFVFSSWEKLFLLLFLPLFVQDRLPVNFHPFV